MRRMDILYVEKGKLRAFFKKNPQPKKKKTGELPNLSRKQLRILTWLLTGHCLLKGHLFQLWLVITIDNQQEATILIYLLLISSICFGRCFRPSSGAYHCNYSFWYCPPMVLLPGVAYWVELTYRWTIPEAVVTVICS